MLLSSLIVPVVMLIGGWMMWKHCPKEINWVLGYRTTRSSKNRNTWRFANQYCGQLWVRLSIIMIILSVLIVLFNRSESMVTILVVIQCIILVASIFLTENALKNTFNTDGTKK